MRTEEIAVGKISRIKTVTAEYGESITDVIDQELKSMSLSLYDLTVNSVVINLTDKPYGTSIATITYSYVGVLDSLFLHFNEYIKELKIPIDQNTMVRRRDLPFGSEIPLKEFYEKGMSIKKGDVLIV